MSAKAEQGWSRSDKALISILQESLPVCPRPYQEVAERLGVGEREVLDKLKQWTAGGVIRRLGASLRHRRVGYQANCMVAWQVSDPNRHREIGRLFAGLPQVSHCYKRKGFENWPYTLYTMVHGADRQETERVIAKMAELSGLDSFRKLYSVREWKKSSMKYFCREGHKP